MIRFENDYTEGAHERILKRIVETNEEQTPGYGMDEHCEKARAYIRKACGSENADVHFLVGGTQTSTTIIASILRPHQGAVAAITGHIAVHESGAIEATGHKVLTLTSDDGKIQAEQVKELYDAHWNDVTHEHMVQAGLVYISHPTENGTTYSKSELEELSETCRECGLPLVLDGASFSLRYDSKTNQQFPILPEDVLMKLGEKYSFSFWEKVDATHSVVRFCTSWATQKENVEMLIEDIKEN